MKYKNKLTGEVHSLVSMLEEWRERYNGKDPHNSHGLMEYYERMEG